MTIEERLTMLEKRLAALEKPSKAFNSDCLTVAEAAEILGVSVATIKSLVRQGRLLPEFMEGKRIFREEDLRRFAKGYAPAKRKLKR